MNRFYFRFFLPAFLMLFLSTINSLVYASTYYVSSTQGDDGRTLTDAKNLSTPWRSIAKVNAMMGSLQAGDQVLFKRGDVFSGTLTVTVSGTSGNPVVFGAYGNGALPELTGFVQLSNWQQKGNGIWETTVPAGLSYLNTVTMNGVARAVGRYPNTSAANQGYLYYQSYNGNSSITDSKLASQNWNGGQVVIRKTRWIIDRNQIGSQSGNTINYNSQSGYGAAQGYGYFIQNHPSTLDTLGEWYYQPNGQKLGIFTGGTSPDSFQIKAGVVETLVQITNQNNVTFDSLNFTGATASALAINASQSIRLSNCTVLFSGKNGIEANNTNGLTVENTIISHTGNNALSINNCTNAILRNNQVRNTGTFAGMGEGGDGTYEAITISGDNNLIANNVIDSTGYIPLNFSGNNVTIKNNVISNFTLAKDDGGGIYTWNNGSNAPTNSGRVITQNIVLNGVGAPGGTDGPTKRFAHGIYIDDGAGQVEISSNTVANCATYGVYIHNAHDIAIKQNTLYNNTTQLYMEHDNVAADKPIYNCTVTGNVLFAKLASQLSAEYKTKDNDIANFGTFDNNNYYRPQDNDLVIGVLQQVNGTYSYNQLSLESWKALYGKDANSTKSSHTVPTYIVNKVVGANQFANGNFDSNVGGLYAYASANNVQTNWDNGKLDGGTLKVSFSSATNSSNYGSVIIGIGAVTAGKQYRLKFSMVGGNNNKAITTYLRQSTGGYADLSVRKAASITSTRVEKEFVFTASATESNASIVFDVPEQPSPVYLDNIKLEQVEATLVNLNQYITFLNNTSGSTQSYATGNQSFDAAGNSYSGSVKLNPFSSLILVTDVAATTATTPVANVTCSATGTILREEWDNVGGTSISNIPLQTKPTSTSQLTAFEGPLNVADNYGSRIRGYVCPPQTGTYTFWIATDDAGELWLSTDSTPANKVRIANIDGWTNFREWGKYPSQKSAQISLQGGQKYYIEALQKEGGGGDNLSVQWQLPDATMETPIAGSHLSPYVDTTKTIAAVGTGTLLREQWDNVGGTNIADIPLQVKPTSSGQITSFEGPLNVADNYGSRIRGYICPSQTGIYTFWVAGDDASELWLSTDQNPTNKVRIANIDSWTNFREWGKFPSQKSTSITLQAGQKYYVEALQKEGGGGDNLSVQWQQPDGSMETPIAGNHIAPYVVTLTDQTISFAALAGKTMGDASFTLAASASSGLPVSFSVASGPATISGNTVSITAAGMVIIAANQSGNTSFNAAKTVTQSFTVMPAATTCQATGTILREEWDNVGGNNISDFPQQTSPTSTSQITAFEGPSNIGDNYASRIRGYICAPQDGNYTFWLAGDDAAELWISADDNPNNKVRIANLYSWTNIREWNKFASQQSAAIPLKAGKKYYVEAIQKEGGGGDNLAVQWQLPNGTIESPLPGKYLSPFVGAQMGTSAMASNFNSAPSPSAIGTTEPLTAAKTGLSVYPNPVAQQANVSFMLKEGGQTDIFLYDAKGQFIRKVFTGVISANVETEIALDAQSLKSGMYMLRLSSGKNLLTKKIIVAK